jgi:hypothetical protein
MGMVVVRVVVVQDQADLEVLPTKQHLSAALKWLQVMVMMLRMGEETRALLATAEVVVVPAEHLLVGMVV